MFGERHDLHHEFPQHAELIHQLLGIHLGSPLYFEAALLIALMGFVGTVALAKYLLRGDIIE